MSGEQVVRYDALGAWMRQVFAAAGLPTDMATNSADVLGYASLHGIDSHGVLALPRYIDHLTNGRLNPAALPETLTQHQAIARIDGHGCLGIGVGPQAMRQCISLAREFGIGAVAVANTSHFGAAGYYTQLAARDGMLALSTSNVEAMMPPFGGAEKLLGNNPLSIAGPGHGDVVHGVDICTSEVAWGKLQLAAAQGERVPEGWCSDANGQPTTDPELGMVGMLTPAAGHKGSGLAFMLEAMTSLLAGGTVGHEVKDEVGLSQLHVAISVGAFRDPHAFRSDLSQLAQSVRTVRPVSADATVLAPGDPESRAATARAQNGIPLQAAAVKGIKAMSRQFELMNPWESSSP